MEELEVLVGHYRGQLEVTFMVLEVEQEEQVGKHLSTPLQVNLKEEWETPF